MNFLFWYRANRALRGTSGVVLVAVLAWVCFGTSFQSGRAEGRALPGGSKTHSSSSPAGASGSVASQQTPYRFVLRSNMVAVVDADTSQLLYAKNEDKITPIASITKLMTAMVTLDAQLPLHEMLVIGDEDVDHIRASRSFLNVGTQLSREDMLHLALMASENRAAACLSRYYPGGRPAFVGAMNRKAHELGMEGSRFSDSSGLGSENVSTALDLVKLVKAAAHYPLIRQFSTGANYDVHIGKRGRRLLRYVNTDRLVGRAGWDIELQKTGYTSESGRCLVMAANVDRRNLIMVFLDSVGTLTRFADASRVRQQLARQQRR